uniref:AAA+ ATPase domain-containing protein n=1 Tax=viral metagenome TaxID=1070528 RepID=A0A6C0LFQ6_9ZZZZ
MSITLYSHKTDTRIILSYIYDLLTEDGKEIDCEYIEIDRKHYRDYKKDNSDYIFLHHFIPQNGTYTIGDINIEISDFILNDKVQAFAFKEEFYHIKKVVLTSSSKEKITTFIEGAINRKFKEKKEKFAEVSGDKIIKKKWTGYCWSYESSIPKRSFDSIFLKEQHFNRIKDPIMRFIDKNTYKDYYKHGIPYKMNIMLHGPPGAGKTSLIHSIASECGANICVLNINSELKEDAMIDAISQVNEDDKKSILVLEDIDCIFIDRKTNDSMKNHITMNGILNCLDGFNNPEGLIVIMTTNFPDKLDEALMRSGRIDLDIELSHLDKFQARNMFLSFFNNEEHFELLWSNIQKYSVEPATLIQFLFNNRSEEDISSKFENFYKLVEKKYSKQNPDIYM